MRIWIWIQHDDPQHTNCCEISAAACTQSYSQVGEVNIPKMRIWITWCPSSKHGDRRFSNCGCEIHQSGWSRGGSTSCPLIQVWHRLPMTTSTFWHLVVSSAFCSHLDFVLIGELVWIANNKLSYLCFNCTLTWSLASSFEGPCEISTNRSPPSSKTICNIWNVEYEYEFSVPLIYPVMLHSKL